MHDLFGEMLLNVDAKKQITRLDTCRLQMKFHIIEGTVRGNFIVPRPSMGGTLKT